MLRVLPVRELTDGNTAKRVVNRIIADEFDYTRVSLWDGKAELVMTGEIKTGDMLSITNASVSGPQAGGVKRACGSGSARRDMSSIYDSLQRRFLPRVPALALPLRGLLRCLKRVKGTAPMDLRWRMRRYLRRHETYLAIGLTYSDYGIERREYGAYPMIVGVHVVARS
ncbi:MAG: hypothetical protein ACP5E9_08305 [Candidatus Methanospirareceae archaeon]